jgi:hypothetical protein
VLKRRFRTSKRVGSSASKLKHIYSKMNLLLSSLQIFISSENSLSKDFPAKIL